MLLLWLYHRDLLKRVFRDDLAVFSERCICYILDFHDVLLNFLLFPVYPDGERSTDQYGSRNIRTAVHVHGI